MTSWGDDMWTQILELEATEGMSIEPLGRQLREEIARGMGAKISPICRHCKQPYLAVDEDDNPRYAGLCIGCAEAARDMDDIDLLIREDEDKTENRRFYSGL